MDQATAPRTSPSDQVNPVPLATQAAGFGNTVDCEGFVHGLQLQMHAQFKLHLQFNKRFAQRVVVMYAEKHVVFFMFVA